ncbi:MAG: S-ribosylhomocysteine lyase, partial [Bacilli bacterium]|nr:S-ribosylhomocysteine lyase [Bacilli bacterium]
MKKIASFTIDHNKLLPGIYASRKDKFNEEALTTFDLRFTRPNYEAVMETSGLHTIEHLGATYLRNDLEWKERIVYFGPMGCRTGFYLIIWGDLKSEDILELLRNLGKY